MELSIDKLGRVVIPKDIRDRWNLTSGSTLDLEETDEGLTLHPAGRWKLTVRQGLTVLSGGHLPAGFAWDQVVEEDREDRIAATLGAPWPKV